MPSTDVPPPFDAYRGDEPYLFVSYAHSDSHLVFPQVSYLHEQGYRVWYDEGIDPGNEWPEEIATALARCGQFLVFVSPNAVSSTNVRNEINFAINHAKPFVAVHLEETALPTGLELRMGDIQAILFYRLDILRYRRQLARALKSNLRTANTPALESPSLGADGLDRGADSGPEATDAGAPKLRGNQPEVPVLINEGASISVDQAVTGDDEVNQLAHRIVVEGSDSALQGVRFARFGGLDIVDPREMESCLDIYALIREYASQPQRVPLPIAAFGPPGSELQFRIQQIALAAISVETETCILPMSSFVDRGDLIAALHRVREIGMTGKLTIVLWDDFDGPMCGVQFGWLTHLLPPISSGSYQDGRATHQIGRGIFVFLSGTAPTWRKFGFGVAPELFRLSRGPEFVSALRGYFEALGVNPSLTDFDEPAPPNKPDRTTKNKNDPIYVIRRAVWLRHFLIRRAPGICTVVNDGTIVNIDPGVVHAFLYTPVYLHGLKSMEALIGMSRLGGQNRFDRHLLPSKSQMSLHTEGETFASLVGHVHQLGDSGPV